MWLSALAPFRETTSYITQASCLFVRGMKDELLLNILNLLYPESAGKAGTCVPVDGASLARAQHIPRQELPLKGTCGLCPCPDSRVSSQAMAHLTTAAT